MICVNYSIYKWLLCFFTIEFNENSTELCDSQVFDSVSLADCNWFKPKPEVKHSQLETEP